MDDFIFEESLNDFIINESLDDVKLLYKSIKDDEIPNYIFEKLQYYVSNNCVIYENKEINEGVLDWIKRRFKSDESLKDYFKTKIKEKLNQNKHVTKLADSISAGLKHSIDKRKKVLDSAKEKANKYEHMYNKVKGLKDKETNLSDNPNKLIKKVESLKSKADKKVNKLRRNFLHKRKQKVYKLIKNFRKS